MNRPTFPALIFSFLLVVCTPMMGSCQNTSTSTGVPASSEYLPAGSTPTALPEETRIVLHSGSLSILVEDPASALLHVQQAVEQAGGHVVSASSWSSPGSAAYSSLSAKVPSSSLSALRASTLDIAEEVQNDSIYTQDVTSDYRLLHKRLQDLSQAQDHIWRLLIETDDPGLASTFTTLRDLIQTEKANVENQLAYYDEQAEFASFDVTLNQPSYFLTPIE